MEVVGQLTGGIAHDFNNLLAIIIGNLELISDAHGPQNSIQPLVNSAIIAAENGAQLNKQLLAFSRQQALSPTVIQINKTVSDLTPALQRILGETIAVRCRFATEAWLSDIDPVQLETSLLNLVVNARDAMPEGGNLTIEIDNVDQATACDIPDLNQADYIRIKISDTGIGMSKDNLDRVFDPFFTTKPMGKGTGLGLSMVFGFAKQSGGHVTIDSKPGKGTTVELYLPRSLQAPKEIVSIKSDTCRSSGETILVVEDNPQLRTLLISLLNDMGFKTLEAEDGPSALAVIKENTDIEVLLTDIMLPNGILGPELVSIVNKSDPGIKTMYISGYSQSNGPQAEKLRDIGPILTKPFRKNDLFRKLQETLHG